MGFICFGGRVRCIGQVPQATRSCEKTGEVQQMSVEPGGGVGAFMGNEMFQT